MNLERKLAAEFLGTFWLLFGGVGSAVLAAGFPELGIGFLGVALAVGLSITTAAYAFGSISGAHFNPAVTLGLWAGGRFAAKDIAPYWIAQIAGGIAGAGVLYLVASGAPGFDPNGGFASTGYGAHSAGHFNLMSCLVAETVFTFAFVTVILAVTRKDAPAGLAPLAIGLTLAVIHLAAIPVTNASVNPARSLATAIFAGGWAIEQVWLFWLAPLSGAVLAGFFARWLHVEEAAPAKVASVPVQTARMAAE
jgi:aquaporin Z